MRVLVENRQRGAVYFISKENLVNHLVKVKMKVIMIQNLLVAVVEVFLRGKRVPKVQVQVHVKRQRGEELPGRNSTRYQTFKDITHELKLTFSNIQKSAYEYRNQKLQLYFLDARMSQCVHCTCIYYFNSWVVFFFFFFFLFLKPPVLCTCKRKLISIKSNFLLLPPSYCSWFNRLIFYLFLVNKHSHISSYSYDVHLNIAS